MCLFMYGTLTVCWLVEGGTDCVLVCVGGIDCFGWRRGAMTVC